MKVALQQEGIGDWFLMEKYLAIRVYCFLVAPLLLPFYLNTSIITLELIRKRIYADEDHFTAHRKDS